MIVVATFAAVAVLAAWAFGRNHRVAVAFGLLLPIEFVDGVSPSVFDALRLLFALWLVVLVRRDVPTERVRVAVPLVGALGALAVLRLALAVANHDPASRTWAVTLGASIVVAVLVAVRSSVHRWVLCGFVAGVSLSGIESILQAMELPSLRTPNLVGQRFPGLSTYTMLLTWQLAAALTICIYLLARSPRSGWPWRLAAVAVPVCCLAMLTNGAQGGLLGIVAALIAVIVWGRGVVRIPAGGKRAVPVVAVVVVAVAGIGFSLLSGVHVPTIRGLVGEGDYVNEKARWSIAVTGWDEMVAHPLRGMGRTQFIAEHTIGPHFLPLEAGAAAGIGGFLLGSAVLLLLLRILWRGPARTPYELLGLALVTMGFAQSLTDPARPFVGISNLAILLVAVVASLGVDGSDVVDGPGAAGSDAQAGSNGSIGATGAIGSTGSGDEVVSPGGGGDA